MESENLISLKMNLKRIIYIFNLNINLDCKVKQIRCSLSKIIKKYHKQSNNKNSFISAYKIDILTMKIVWLLN
jgi:hypothetical protein